MEDDVCSKVTKSLLQDKPTGASQPLNDLADAKETDIYEESNTGVIMTLECAPCKLKHKQSTAVFICPECDNVLLCDDCSEIHKSMKSTRSHELVESVMYYKTKTLQSLFCDPCGTRNIKVVAKYFCENCENELFCGGCSENHRSMKSTRSHVLVEAEKYKEKSKRKLLFCDPCGFRKIKEVAKCVCEECGYELLCEGCSESHTSMKSTRSHFLMEAEKYIENTRQETMFCDPCGTRNIKSVAKFFCQECEDELLCEGCFDNHRSMKSTRSHVLIEVEKYTEKTKQRALFCDPCGTRNIKVEAKFVCEICENELLCEECSDNHKSMKSTRSHVLMEVDKYSEKIKRVLLFCDPCTSRNIMVVAKYFCQECENELLCGGCSETHKSMKSTRSHVLTEAEKYSEKTKQGALFCDPCGTRNIKVVAKFVCEKCENELLCEECSDNHKSMKSTRSHDLIEAEKYTKRTKEGTLVCDPCGTRNIKKAAIYFCHECENELLCKECADNHKSMKSTRLHILTEAEKYTTEITQDSLLCDPCGTRHIKVVAKYVCEKCENELLCEGCSDNHKSMKSTRSHVLVEAERYYENTNQKRFFCEPCSTRSIKVIAKYVCEECGNELLCKGCYENHKSMKSTRSHILIEVKEYVDKTKQGSFSCDPCGRRNIKITAKYVCEDCENELLCEGCANVHKSMKSTCSHTLKDANIHTKGIKQDENLADSNGFKIQTAQLGSDVGETKNRKERDGREPGQPRAYDIGFDTITLSWTKPDTFQEDGLYQIFYKQNKSPQWRFFNGDFKITTVELTNLDPNCEYYFRVCFVNKDGESINSIDSDVVKTLPSPANALLQYSVQQGKSDVSPKKFALPTTEMKDARNEKAKTRRFDVGTGLKDVSEKTIMMIGETGTGKSTLVDGMVNYILGVRWSDPFRFTMVNLEEEEQNRSNNQALSQTEWITCYTVHYREGNRIQYKINIIDTPGFGDTRGLDRDQAIVKQIHELFIQKPPKGILTIDAVCFLIKAPDARLTAMQNYIFQSIMSLFGKDIEKNICSLITFADGIDPPVFAALDESKLPFGKRFTFNNSGLYAKNTDIEQFSLSPMFFDMGIASFRSFFKHLETLQRKSLQLTSDVLNERSILEATINNLQPKLDAGLIQVNRLKNEIQILKDNEKTIENNKQFTYTVTSTKQTKIDLPKGQHVTNCLNCNFTCHEKCVFANDDEKRHCSAMDTNGNCKICPDKCFWQKHANTRYIFKYDVIEETKTYEEMKEKYEKATGHKMTQEQVLDTMTQELEALVETVEEMMEVIMHCNKRLSEIALRPNPLTMTDHIDLMIENEKYCKGNGFLARIESLNKLKERAKVLEVAQNFSNEAKSVVGRKPKSNKFLKDLLNRIGHLF